MKSLRRWLGPVMTAGLLLALSACGDSASTGSNTNDNTNDNVNINTNDNTNTTPLDGGVVDGAADAGECTPDCTGRVCGSDGCDGTCGTGCGAGESCNDAGQCSTGYVLYNPNGTTTTYLVDTAGSVVHQWSHSRPGGYSVYLLDNGNLLRPAAASNIQLHGGAFAGLLQEVNPSGTVVWEYEYNSSTYLTHHDVEPMPNGNVLLIAWEVKSSAEVAAAGRTSSGELWPDHIIEVEPSGSSGGTIVWEWHAWDHLVQDSDSSKPNYAADVSDHPERIDVNLGATSMGPPGSSADWLHINGISYNVDRDEIAITSHNMDEVYVIDHSTVDYSNPAAGIAAAAGSTGGNRGKGGDLLYRWGNPSNYASGTTMLYVVHCPWFVPAGLPGAGNLLLYNNGDHRPGGNYSSIEEIVLPVDSNGDYILTNGVFGPTTVAWTYSSGTSFYSNHLGGVQRLPNGNTFIVESTSSYFFEVDAGGTVVWTYSAQGGEVARALRYGADHPGVAIVLGN